MKIESKLISVIVPVYNTSKYLPQCLDSLLNQTYPNLEIICVDDGSTDNSWEVLQEYAAKDNRVKVFHQENAGVSVARNKALAHATGEWLSFIDSDDWLDLDTYEKCAKGMLPGVDVVFFGARLDWEDGRSENGCNRDLAPDEEGCLECSCSIILDNILVVWNKVIRHDFWKKYQLSFPEGRAYAEDGVVAYCVLAVARKIYCIPNRFYHYRQRQESAVGKSLSSLMGKEFLDNIYSWYYVHSFSLKYDLSEVAKKTLPYLLWRYARKTEAGVVKELRSMVRQEIIKLIDVFKIKEVETCDGILHLLDEKRTFLEKPFHWFRRDTECFGLFGKSIWSITYYPTIKVHRFMGKKVFSAHYKTIE